MTWRTEKLGEQLRFSGDAMIQWREKGLEKDWLTPHSITWETKLGRFLIAYETAECNRFLVRLMPTYNADTAAFTIPYQFADANKDWSVRGTGDRPNTWTTEPAFRPLSPCRPILPLPGLDNMQYRNIGRVDRERRMVVYYAPAHCHFDELALPTAAAAFDPHEITFTRVAGSSWESFVRWANIPALHNAWICGRTAIAASRRGDTIPSGIATRDPHGDWKYAGGLVRELRAHVDTIRGLSMGGR